MKTTAPDAHRTRLAGRSGVALAAVLLAVLPAGASAEDANDTPDARTSLEKGPIQRIAPTLATILRVTLEGNRLRLDRAKWQSGAKNPGLQPRVMGGQIILGGAARAGSPTLQTLVRNLHSAAGGGGFISTAAGQGRRMSFASHDLAISVTEAASTFQLQVSELAGPGRLLQFESTVEGVLRITLLDADSGFVFLFGQRADGAVSLLHVRPDRVVRGKGETFLAYYHDNRRYMQDEVFPLLSHIGIDMGMKAHDPNVAAAALEALRDSPDAEETARYGKLIEQLDSDSYTKREQAMTELSAGYKRCFRQIDRALKDESNSPERAARLRRIAAENAGQAKSTQLVASLKLLDDAHYLVRLLGIAEEKDRGLIAARLRKITGKDLGADVKAWQQYIGEARPDKGPPKQDPKGDGN